MSIPEREKLKKMLEDEIKRVMSNWKRKYIGESKSIYDTSFKSK